MSQSRQLAAIMFTDIVGYTALMGNDEQKAFELLSKNRQIQKPIIEQFNGRWIKELGDGVMASFNTVSDAVNAAIKIQQTCNVVKDFQLRIGIHLGEVVFENDDVFGDGVNIAARIQALATPGGIWVSESVHNNIANKIDIDTEFVKTEHLKNVKEPVRIYQVKMEGVETAEPVHSSTESKTQKYKKLVMFFVGAALIMASGYFLYNSFQKPTKEKTLSKVEEKIDRSIAVLPFADMSEGKDQEYFSDGMTESIITDLTKLQGLLVIARNSTFQYKGKSVDVKKVGEELNVRYVLEGSVQRAANQLRVNAQLIDVTTGYHLWAERYDKEMKDIFAVQDDISRHIVAALNIALRPDQAKRTGLPPTKNIEAYDAFLQGLFYWQKPDRLSNEKAIEMLEKAVTLDPQFALAHAHLSLSYTEQYFIYDPRKEWEQKAFVEVQKALSLDPNLAEAYGARGGLAWTLSNRFPHETAIKDFSKALELNPNLAQAHSQLGTVYHHVGLLDQALEELDWALRIDPNNLAASNQRAMVYLSQGQYEKVFAEWEKQPGLSTVLRYAPLNKIPALDYLGKKKEALALVAEILKQGPENEVAFGVHAVLLAGTADHRKAEEQIAQAIQFGEGKGHFHHVQYFIGSAYALMGKKDQAIEWLQKAAEEGFPSYPLYEKDPYLNNVRSDPRFVSFMEKLKKQWENYKANL